MAVFGVRRQAKRDNAFTSGEEGIGGDRHSCLSPSSPQSEPRPARMPVSSENVQTPLVRLKRNASYNDDQTYLPFAMDLVDCPVFLYHTIHCPTASFS